MRAKSFVFSAVSHVSVGDHTPTTPKLLKTKGHVGHVAGDTPSESSWGCNTYISLFFLWREVSLLTWPTWPFRINDLPLTHPCCDLTWVSCPLESTTYAETWGAGRRISVPNVRAAAARAGSGPLARGWPPEPAHDERLEADERACGLRLAVPFYCISHVARALPRAHALLYRPAVGSFCGPSRGHLPDETRM
jgi:hypothetical protein